MLISLILFVVFSVLYAVRILDLFKTKRYFKLLFGVLCGILFWVFYIRVIIILGWKDGGLGQAFDYVFTSLFALPLGTLIIYGAMLELLSRVGSKKRRGLRDKALIALASGVTSFLLLQLQLHY